MRAFALALTLVSSVLAAGCTGSKETAVPVDTESCADVFYEGEGKPDAIIVSDLPLRSPDQPAASAMVRVIEGTLRQRRFRAGEHRVGYQSCDGGYHDPGLCERSAKTYAATKDVLGMIGTMYSNCAALQIPLLSRRAAGPLAMVSATNTDPGLTRRTPFSDHDPEPLYVDGVRNYVRVVPSDDAVGAAAAILAKQMGARRVVALVNRGEIGFDWYGPSLGAGFIETARGLGLVTTEFEWRAQRSYTSIARRVAGARPQLVFLAGHTQYNARRLLEDLRRELGPKVVFAGGDQFLTLSPKEWGPVGEGMRVAVNHQPLEVRAPAARRFLRSVGLSPKDDFLIGPSEAAHAAGILLDAIARSDGSRASVVEELFETRVKDGTFGSFSFDQRGDIAPAAVALYSIRNGAFVVDGVVRVPSRPDN